ncbi:hypothetical protein DRQ36_03600 [bacterium]|nr:MAG: hypothetical protein DRQ36_03600 [bacterium]
MHISINPWVWLGVFFTFSVLSFLYKDNPFYKLAEHVTVGVSIGYGMVIIWHNALIPRFYMPVFQEGKLILIIPAILGLMMILRIVPKYSWLSRYAICFSVGGGAGLAIPRSMQASVLRQLEATMLDLGFTTTQGINNIVIFVGVLAVLIYFFFSKEHKGVFGGIAKLGIWFLMVGFGATFGYTVMARLSLFIGRVLFVLQDFLGINLAG